MNLLAGSGEDTTLFVRQLCDDVATKTNLWKEIAQSLQISRNDIERIDLESGESILERFSKVFEKWRREKQQPFIWSTMVNVLRSPAVGEHALANELDQKYCQ